MKTLIIPCCGLAMIANQPNYLAKHPNGRFLLQECVDDVRILAPDRLVIPVLREHDNTYSSAKFIQSILKDAQPTPEVVILKERTGGPAETVYHTIQAADIEGGIIIHDADVKLRIDAPPPADFVVGIDLMQCGAELLNIRNKAFLKINEDNIILDVIEKQIVSNHAAFGMYSFSKASDFVDAYTELTDVNYQIDKLYVSNIIAYLIGVQNKVFHYIQANSFEDWDDQHNWQRLKNRFGTLFVNADHLFPKYLDQLSLLVERGAQLIFYSSCHLSEAEALQAELSSARLGNYQLITDCQNGMKKLLTTPDDIEQQILRSV